MMDGKLGKTILGACLAVAALAALPGAAIADSPDPYTMDYSMVYNSTFNDIDLQVAKTMHLSDGQVAKLVIIATKSGSKLCDVLSCVSRGETINTIANHYGVSLSDVNHYAHEEDTIAAYQAACATIGFVDTPIYRPELAPHPGGGMPASSM